MIACCFRYYIVLVLLALSNLLSGVHHVRMVPESKLLGIVIARLFTGLTDSLPVSSRAWEGYFKYLTVIIYISDKDGPYNTKDLPAAHLPPLAGCTMEEGGGHMHKAGGVKRRGRVL